MIAYASEDGFAVVDAISERRYVLNVYGSKECWRTCHAPLATHRLIGTPNASQILTALGNGSWEDVSDECVPECSSVPPSVTARQIRLWLVSHGVSLSSVDAAIDAISDATQRDRVRVEWEYAPYVERGHPMLLPLAAALGWTSEQVDTAFREAEVL